MGAAHGRPCVRLLLDEMYDPAIAERLDKHRSIDARAIAELRGQPDAAVFAFATHDRRALVTENVADFVPLVQQAVSSRRDHSGVIFTSNRSFPRARPATTGAIVKALEKLAASKLDLTNQMLWLAPDRQ